jgi:hypothetical protein
MAYIPVRIDFVEPGTQCTRIADNGRHHGFKTNTATILMDEASGKEYPFGPKCTEYIIADKSLLRGIPDFTTRDFTLEEGEGDGGTGGGSGSGAQSANASDSDKAQAFAKRYIMLRMDRVANIPGIQSGIKFAPLANIYAPFQQTRELSDGDINYIINLEKSPKTPAAFRSNHLLDVYTAYVQLQRHIKKTKPGRYLDFLMSVRDTSLLQNLKLSSTQIEKAKLKLHPQAFQG